MLHKISRSLFDTPLCCEKNQNVFGPKETIVMKARIKHKRDEQLDSTAFIDLTGI